MPARAPSDPDTAMMLGEMRGQLRELIHQGNNQAMKNDAVAKALAKLESIPDQLTKIEQRLTALETDKNRRDGAYGFGGAVLRSPNRSGTGPIAGDRTDWPIIPQSHCQERTDKGMCLRLSPPAVLRARGSGRDLRQLSRSRPPPARRGPPSGARAARGDGRAV